MIVLMAPTPARIAAIRHAACANTDSNVACGSGAEPAPAPAPRGIGSIEWSPAPDQCNWTLVPPPGAECTWTATPASAARRVTESNPPPV